MWTRALHRAGIDVVTPIELAASNPGQVDGSWWVVYPFVEGDPYEASAMQLEAAGRLLGQIHAAAIDAKVLGSLRSYRWPTIGRDEIDEELATLAEVVELRLGSAGQHATRCLRSLGERWWSSSLPELLAAGRDEPLPCAGVSSDYKANNLVFGDGRATLIDPDNGGLEPRIFDLAMAAVLFHTERAGAPGRLFEPREWNLFVASYLAQVDLTRRERELWPAALDHMLWEEGTWLIRHSDDADWSDERQAAYLADLAVAHPARYPLP